MHAAHHRLLVEPLAALADARDLVAERDQAGKQRVGRVFDHLRVAQRGAHDGAGEALEQARHDLGGTVVGSADDNAVGIEKIGNGASLAQEFRRHRQPELAKLQ